MSHIVMQAAEFPSVDAAINAEGELNQLYDAYVVFEQDDPNPWSADRIAPPLVKFGAKHGVEWTDARSARFTLRGPFEDSAEVLRADRMVFFSGGGFDLGGEPLRQVLRNLGATRVEETFHLEIRVADADARLAELVQFLEDEDFEDQFTVGETVDERTYFSLTIVGNGEPRTLTFDDSGVQDWAFVSILPQLDGEDPRFLAE